MGYPPPELRGSNSANTFAPEIYTVVEADASPVGSGVGCSFWRRRLVGVATCDVAPGLTFVAFLRGRGSLCVSLSLFLLRRTAAAVSALVDDVLRWLPCAGFGIPAGFVGLVWGASARYLDRPAVPRRIFPDALGTTTQR